MSVSATNASTSLSPLNLLNANAVSLKANAKAATAKTTSSTSTTSTGGLDGTTAGTTFLNLLVKELQNQDPTAPMDSTAMVGQMISLNQLDQLISINQVLGAASKSTSTTPATGKTAGSDSVNSSTLMAERAALMNSASPSNSINAATLAASDPSTTLDFSTLNTQFGAK